MVNVTPESIVTFGRFQGFEVWQLPHTYLKKLARGGVSGRKARVFAVAATEEIQRRELGVSLYDRPMEECPDWRNSKAFRDRERNLKTIGFKSYYAYINSMYWKRIRDAVIQKYKKCVRCGEPATEVHHTSYNIKVLTGQNMHCLQAVCRDCHRYGHTPNGPKVIPRVRRQKSLAKRKKSKGCRLSAAHVRAKENAKGKSAFERLNADKKQKREITTSR